MSIYAGQGTILSATISSSLTAIVQVIEVDGPDAKVDTKETTNLSSTSKSYRAQLPDGGTVSATVQYDPAQATHVFLTTAINTWPQQPVLWSVTFPQISGSHGASFSAILTSFKPKGMNEEDNLEADIELKITGLITWT